MFYNQDIFWSRTKLFKMRDIQNLGLTIYILNSFGVDVTTLPHVLLWEEPHPLPSMTSSEAGISIFFRLMPLTVSSQVSPLKPQWLVTF